MLCLSWLGIQALWSLEDLSVSFRWDNLSMGPCCVLLLINSSSFFQMWSISCHLQMQDVSTLVSLGSLYYQHFTINSEKNSYIRFPHGLYISAWYPHLSITILSTWQWPYKLITYKLGPPDLKYKDNVGYITKACLKIINKFLLYELSRLIQALISTSSRLFPLPPVSMKAQDQEGEGRGKSVGQQVFSSSCCSHLCPF